VAVAMNSACPRSSSPEAYRRIPSNRRVDFAGFAPLRGRSAGGAKEGRTVARPRGSGTGAFLRWSTQRLPPRPGGGVLAPRSRNRWWYVGIDETRRGKFCFVANPYNGGLFETIVRTGGTPDL